MSQAPFQKFVPKKKNSLIKEEFKQAVVAPRSNCVLSTDKLQSVFPIQTLLSALANCIPKYNEI